MAVLFASAFTGRSQPGSSCFGRWFVFLFTLLATGTYFSEIEAHSMEVLRSQNADGIAERVALWSNLANNFSRSSEPSCGHEKSAWLGYVFTAISTIFFSACYLATKQVRTGDGMFYQWVFCSAVFVCGAIINGIKKSPPFQPLAMIGGVTFATGNALVVPIVSLIGFGMGMVLSASLSALVGWASARFGLLGVKAETPCSSLLDYLGISFCLLSLILFLFVKSDDKENANLRVQSSPKELSSEEKRPLLNIQEGNQAPSAISSWMNCLDSRTRRLLGCTLAMLAGVMYGVSFNPVTHLQQQASVANVTGSSDKTAALDYVFSHFSGIYVTSTVYFVAYSLLRRNSPHLYPKAVLPAFLSGAMWSVASSSWLVANDLLGQAITYPILTTVPSFINSLFAIFLFKEIRGRRNLGIFSFAFLLTGIGVTLSGLSKVVGT